MADGLEKQKVLIVDDAPENIQVLMETLKQDYKIVAANNGQKALQMAEMDPVPDIILLDIMMPGIDGYEVCKRLKTQKKTREIPIIFVTALDQEDDESFGLKLGAVDYITKPISPSIVKARVQTHLNLRNTQQKLQDLLNKTLSGSVRILIDLLSLVNPTAFSRSSQMRRLVKEMALKLGLTDVWKFGLAAQLSQIGCITMPTELLNKVYYGKELTDEEQELYQSYPAIGARLIARIPHLESVSGMIARHQEPLAQEGPIEPRRRDAIVIGAQLLKIAIDSIQMVNSGMSQESVIQQMRNNKEMYDPDLVDMLAEVLGINAQEQIERKVTIEDIFPDMILNQDVYSEAGTLLAVKGTELSLATIKFLRTYDNNEKIKSPILVLASKNQSNI